MRYFQGDDVRFSIRCNNAQWSDFTCVDIYFYTSEENKMKFSTDASKGYAPLELDAEFAKGVIPSDATKLMHGNVIVEFHVTKSNGDDICKVKRTDIVIEKTTIKKEVL